VAVLAASVVSTALAIVLFASVVARALVINEVIADNLTQEPEDIACGHPDMVEIYNDTGELIDLGHAVLDLTYYLSCVPAEDSSPAFENYRTVAWPFPPSRSQMPSGGRLTVFCDGNSIEGTCELHASFGLASDGSDTVVLWGPDENGDGLRSVVDRVYLPPTEGDVTWGRYPDGAGGPNVPVEEHYDHFVFYPPGQSSFGVCQLSAGICLVNASNRRNCLGAANRAPQDSWNLPPRISRIAQTTNAPGPDETVRFTVRVRDDRVPTPANIDRVEICYRVLAPGAETWGAEHKVEMRFLDTGGVDDSGVLASASRPLDRYTHWDGEIPGQPSGSRVEFFFRAVDAGGLSATRPRRLCHLMDVYGEGVGPCDRDFGGGDADHDDADDNGCLRDEDSISCRSADGSGCDGGPDGGLLGERYIACNVRSTYFVGYVPRAEVASLVINEVVASQTDLLTDFSERACNDPNRENTPGCLSPIAGQPSPNPDCCRRDEDFIEFFNTSDEDVAVEGLWLSDSRVDPRRWQFPSSAVIPANTRVIVWLDRDGGRCPDPLRGNRPCFWECPDPNTLSMQNDPPEFHAGFALDADGDQIYLYDNEANGFGLIHGLNFGDPSSFCGFVESFDTFGNPRNDLLPDQSLSLIPDGDPTGRFVITQNATPKEGNSADCLDVVFRRGDATDDGVTDISDGVFILNFLFSGGSAPGCLDGADSDDNAAIELSDAVRVFAYLFLGGDPPPDPGPSICGPDPTEDGLGDCEYESCEA